MKFRYNKRYFPFAPGVPWLILNDRYVIPKLDADIWLKTIENKNAMVVCHGGPLEVFLSLSALELLNIINKSRELYWCTSNNLDYFYNLNGLGKKGPDINKETLTHYPLPLFIDRNNNWIFFNVLNNYLDIHSFKQDKSIPNKKILVKQITDNLLVDWSVDYVPKLRNLTTAHDDKYMRWIGSFGAFGPSKKFILIINNNSSLHKIDCLMWSPMQIREFAAMTKALNISVIVCGPEYIRDHYINSNIFFAPEELLLILIKNSWMVLSDAIDFLLISAAISDAIIVSRIIGGIYNINKNAELLGHNSIIYAFDELKPIDIYNCIRYAND